MSFELSEPTNQKPYSVHEDEPVCWGETTDPDQHNPDNFRYLVHAFNPFSLFNAIYTSKETDASNDEVRRQSIDLRIRPEDIDERVSVSMSLIENGRTATYGSGGIIVQAPESSIVLTSPTDAGAINSNKERLVAQGQSRGLLSPDQLLERGSPRTYNEVVALGRSGLRAVGFFYKVDSRKNLLILVWRRICLVLDIELVCRLLRSLKRIFILRTKLSDIHTWTLVGERS